jgi:hypothetical protein
MRLRCQRACARPLAASSRCQPGAAAMTVATRRRVTARKAAIACSARARSAVARALLCGLVMQQRLSLTVAALAAAVPLSTASAQPSAESPPAESPPGATATATERTGDDEPWLGVGVARTLDGTWGPSLRLGRDLQLELVVGGNLFRYSGGGYHQSRQQVAARVLVPLLRRDRGWLGLVAGLAGGRMHVGDDYLTRTSWTGSAEAGIHAELFVTPALSLGLEVGASGSVGGDVVDVPGAEHYTENGWYSSEVGRAAGAASLTYWLGVADEAPASPSALRVGVGALAGFAGHGLAVALDLGRLRVDVAGFREGSRSDLWSWQHTRLSLGALHEVSRSGPVSVSTGLRVSRAAAGDDIAVNTSFGVAAPLRIEVDVAPWLSLHTEGGVEATVVPEHDGLGAALGAMGTIGFTAWL